MKIIPARDFRSDSSRLTPDPRVGERVADIIRSLTQRGEEALREYVGRFDGVETSRIVADAADMARAYEGMEPSLRDSLRWMWDQVSAYHHKEPAASQWEGEGDLGRYGQRVLPVDACGIYVPGGRYPYPSSLIMAAAPARVAGVRQLLVASPPASNGLPHPDILGAAHIAGCRLALGAGGAHGLAALALGVLVPRVDMLVGPGGDYVQEAKRQLGGLVGVDLLAGPSELAVVAEQGAARPSWLALDLLAQLEHGPGGRLYLFTPDPALAREVIGELERLIESSPDREALEEYLRATEALAVVTDSTSQAVELAGRAQPEHVLLAVQSPRTWLESLEGGAAVYLGQHTPPAMGDYGSGPTHVLPTGGTSAFSSGLGVDRFLRRQSFFEARQVPSRFSRRVSEAEGLSFHTRSMESRGLEAVRLDANELPTNPCAPLVERAVSGAASQWNRYPPRESPGLSRSLADYTGLDPEGIVLGAGADELILSLALAFRDQEWLIPAPDFAMYGEVAEWVGLGRTSVPLEPGFGFPARDLNRRLSGREKGSTLVILSRPHNPSGRLWPRGHLEEILEAGSWLVVDEAYFEFSGCSVVDWVGRHRRLILLRTLSKAFGLAGLRVGYLLAEAEVAARVRDRRLPFSVAGPSQQAAAVFLRERDRALEAAGELCGRRDRFRERLQSLGLRVEPSRANFLLIRVGDGPGVHEFLQDRGFAVRCFAGPAPLEQFIRVTVGTETENNGLAWELEAAMKAGVAR